MVKKYSGLRSSEFVSSKSVPSESVPSSAPAAGSSAYTIKAKKEEKKESQKSEWKENVVAITVVTVIVLVVVGLFQGWFTPAPAPVAPGDKRWPIGIDDDPLLGSLDAPVTIIEFSDYTCSACFDFQMNTWPALKAAYIDTGKARFVYRDYPLDQIHPGATNVAATVNCAGEQGAFWEFHDAFYQHQGSLDEAFVEQLATENDLNLTVLNECRASGRQHTEIQADQLDGLRNGEVSGTPTFFINGRKLVGSQPFEAFETLINEELNVSTPE